MCKAAVGIRQNVATVVFTEPCHFIRSCSIHMLLPPIEKASYSAALNHMSSNFEFQKLVIAEIKYFEEIIHFLDFRNIIVDNVYI